MAALPDSVKMTHMSLPGTHDTMTYKTFREKNVLYGSVTTGTQFMTLKEQLESGIRVLDIRVRDRRNWGPKDVFVHGATLPIYHGPLFAGSYFGPDVLKACTAFLKAHPTETIFMRVDFEDAVVIDEAIDNPVTQAIKRVDQSNKGGVFQIKFDADLTNPAYLNGFDPANPSDANGAFWIPPASATTYTRPNPTLGELRGKIVFIWNFKKNNPHPTDSYDRLLNGVVNNYGIRFESARDAGNGQTDSDPVQIPGAINLPNEA